jgi:SlyX protein
MEMLETRLMYQESALEELTRSLLDQQRLVREHCEAIERLEAQLRALTVSNLAPQDQETPPPHY